MSDAVLRVSVRKMVEFSLRGGDLLPVSMQAMQAGARGHVARQSAESAEAEKSLKWRGECEGLLCEITGRADMFWNDCTPPCVEELKLAAEPPDAPMPQHRMQAVCYAFMLCETLSLPAAAVRVSYIAESGAVLRSFEETLSHEEARAAFFSVLQPLAAWEKRQRAYRQRRDASLAALPFPYDAYRPGQREMAVQVYTAIRRKKRLFSILPTGTGKSIAALYPALKALGEGHTQQIFYLTARGTAQLSALDALAQLRKKGLRLRAIILTAREKCCPVMPMHCHPDHCPRARGYYDRELAALLRLADMDEFTPESIAKVCDDFRLCPFEFSLLLSEYSDVVICDYNYVFDPMVSLRRIIGQGMPVTLLIDEAHNLPSRTRSMLSAALDSRALSQQRRECGRLHGRRDTLYQAFTALLQPLRAFEESSDPAALEHPLEELIDAMSARLTPPQPEGFTALFRELLQFRFVLQRCLAQPEDYRVLCTGGERERTLQLLCLEISAHLAAATRRMNGCVYFSATLTPLPEMCRLLGGSEEDALFSLPSPFPPENLLVLCQSTSTHYQKRQENAARVASAILTLYNSRPGSYIAYFPSYAYLELIRGELLRLCPELPLNVQERGMDEGARAAFLSRIRSHDGALLSLCVLGGIFAEGVDLPGMQLIGTAVVGVGLPQVNDEQEALRAHYDRTLDDGFAYAYRYPGMQKVLQAAGRVIRSEHDKGIVLLIDARYCQSGYSSLLPAHYHPVFVDKDEEIRAHTQEFWRFHGIQE